MYDMIESYYQRADLLRTYVDVYHNDNKKRKKQYASSENHSPHQLR